MEKSKLVYRQTSAFLRDYKKLPADLQEKVEHTLLQIQRYFETGTALYGLRIKSLSPKIFEGRADIHTRIVFFKGKEIIKFICVGNHQDVERALKNLSALIKG